MKARPVEIQVTKVSLTVSEAASWTGLQVHVLMNLARKGDLPCIKVGRDYLFLADDLLTWLSKQRHTEPLQDDFQDTEHQHNHAESNPVETTHDHLSASARSKNGRHLG